MPRLVGRPFFLVFLKSFFELFSRGFSSSLSVSLSLSLVPSSLLIFDLLTSAVSLPMASASSGLALRIRIRRGLGGGGGGGRGFAAAATDDSDGRGGRGRRRNASPVIVLFPCLLLERERKRESCLSGKRAVVACVRPRTLPPLPLRSEKQSEREKFGGARFFRLCVFALNFSLCLSTLGSIYSSCSFPLREDLSRFFSIFSPCLSLFDTTKPASHGPGFRSGALPPRQENRGEARRRARRRASSSGSSRSFVLAFVVVVAVRCTPRAASAIPPRLGPRREHQHFYPRGTTRERSLPPTRLRRKRRSTGGGERERERERKEGKKKRPCI